MDRHTKEQRSYNMSRIHSKNTTPELVLRKALFRSGLRYRIHYKLLGKPDIVFVGKRLVVFVDGEWWHGRHYKEQSAEWPEFWQKKIAANITRDRKIRSLLRLQGWTVLRVWDRDLQKNATREINKVIKAVIDE